MSKAEILAQLPQHTPEERDEIRLRLAALDNRWLDEDDPLTDDQKRLVESRIEAHEKHREMQG